MDFNFQLYTFLYGLGEVRGLLYNHGFDNAWAGCKGGYIALSEVVCPEM